MSSRRMEDLEHDASPIYRTLWISVPLTLYRLLRTPVAIIRSGVQLFSLYRMERVERSLGQQQNWQRTKE